jgi:cytochrome P450
MELSALPELDVFAAEYAERPLDAIDAVRPLGPVARSSRGIELLSHAACFDMLREPQLTVAFAKMFATSGITEGRAYDVFALNGLMAANPADHARMRKVLAPFFAPAEVESLRPLASALATEWLRDALEADRCDMAAFVGHRLPPSLFCRMIGAPSDDVPRLTNFSQTMNQVFHFDRERRDEIEAAFADGEAYMLDLIERRAARPGDDLISLMIAAEARGELTRDEVVNIAINILGGSTDGTNASMCMVFIALAEHPDQWRLLKQQPALLRSAIQEARRVRSAVLSITRIPPEEIELCGVTIPEDVAIVANVLGANFDPEAFERPRQMDIARKSKTPFLNFGLGHHFYVGQFVAMLVLEETLRAALTLWSEFSVDGVPTFRGAPYPLLVEQAAFRFVPQ